MTILIYGYVNINMIYMLIHVVFMFVSSVYFIFAVIYRDEEVTVKSAV